MSPYSTGSGLLLSSVTRVLLGSVSCVPPAISTWVLVGIVAALPSCSVIEVVARRLLLVSANRTASRFWAKANAVPSAGVPVMPSTSVACSPSGSVTCAAAVATLNCMPAVSVTCGPLAGVAWVFASSAILVPIGIVRLMLLPIATSRLPGSEASSGAYSVSAACRPGVPLRSSFCTSALTYGWKCG